MLSIQQQSSTHRKIESRLNTNACLYASRLSFFLLYLVFLLFFNTQSPIAQQRINIRNRINNKMHMLLIPPYIGDIADKTWLSTNYDYVFEQTIDPGKCPSCLNSKYQGLRDVYGNKYELQVKAIQKTLESKDSYQHINVNEKIKENSGNIMLRDDSLDDKRPNNLLKKWSNLLSNITNFASKLNSI
ncbi:hypothetical protein TRFO_30537 [Tritrichomonas foetus]|uniref:Uncharacterized protein n=1 Tax=Tritrichomonas foetus TaxID=1144522 RepID=A0A1J4JUL6_9EUKA|nr:hypothetical protein TRFO_30537 [Tritrichomonas foetus]|eukprot:OHT02402.1 hypothetical protein TRFO_30537 [Tritrichomonas foetus]